ncbi:Hypothetical protein P9211_09301 [Prochlorococcus marinus str. MIT 9211]|uniref:Uncharacterized protein n=1 Tax=Prochlorococcus marinus (strain MIT 9211) TaxID=93059 RepID=A9BAJ9_PROM4|nr:Hypothetical protein P9211_09301 [Prochlorococcus marinus str. MIT 9211]
MYMTSSGSKRKRKLSSQYIFRGKSAKKNKTVLRNLIEALIMLVTGSNLILFLNTLPNGFNLQTFFLEIWKEVSDSLTQLVESFAKISGAFVVLLLLVTSLILIIGGSVRLFRILIMLLNTNKINNS